MSLHGALERLVGGRGQGRDDYQWPLLENPRHTRDYFVFLAQTSVTLVSGDGQARSYFINYSIMKWHTRFTFHIRTSSNCRQHWSAQTRWDRACSFDFWRPQEKPYCSYKACFPLPRSKTRQECYVSRTVSAAAPSVGTISKSLKTWSSWSSRSPEFDWRWITEEEFVGHQPGVRSMLFLSLQPCRESRVRVTWLANSSPPFMHSRCRWWRRSVMSYSYLWVKWEAHQIRWSFSA